MKDRQKHSGILRVLECVLLLCFVAFLALFVRRTVLDASARREAEEMRMNILSSMPEASQDAALTEEAETEAYRHGSCWVTLSLTDSALSGFHLFGDDGLPAEPEASESSSEGDERAILPELERAREQSKEIVGILQAGEDIDLYVVQGSDNDFYLTHNVLGQGSESGAAFLDARCKFDPRDTHLMIHGHNMHSGVIFGNLDNFGDPEYLKEYPIVYWTTLYEREVYVPYAIAEINVDPQSADYVEMPQWNFETDEQFMQFVQALQNRTKIQLPIDVQPGDELLSLVTCSYGYDDGRFVVALRKLRDDEDEATLTELIRSSVLTDPA